MPIQLLARTTYYSKSQQFDNPPPRHLHFTKETFIWPSTYIWHKHHFAEFLKRCVEAQMNRLSVPLWANVVCIVRDTTFIWKKRKKESKIEEKITNFNELREEIVWLPKRSNCDTPALYKTVLYTAQPVSRCKGAWVPKNSTFSLDEFGAGILQQHRLAPRVYLPWRGH